MTLPGPILCPRRRRFPPMVVLALVLGLTGSATPAAAAPAIVDADANGNGDHFFARPPSNVS